MSIPKDIEIKCQYERKNNSGNTLTGNVILNVKNLDPDHDYTLEIKDHGYKRNNIKKAIPKSRLSTGETILLDLRDSSGWYDFSVRIRGNDDFEKRYAGRVETGKESITDPVMA